MGNKTFISVLVGIFILFLILFVPACGEFLGFSSLPEVDLGNIKKIKVYLSRENLLRLYNTVLIDTYVPCLYSEGDWRIEAYIKVRGKSTIICPKKSFTVKITTNTKIERYCIKNFSVKDRLAFFTYKALGLGVPVNEGAALFINNEYIGCYTRIKLYNEEDLKTGYYDKPGQLFKCFFDDIGSDNPLHHLSTKKFPDDNDFSRLHELVYNVKNLDTGELNIWIDENIDKDEIVKYMVAHDFLAIFDTEILNFYIYDYNKMFLLPWDNEFGMNLNDLRPIGGNNIITRRLLEEPYIRTHYNDLMQAAFIHEGENNIVSTIINELDRICNEIDRAVYYDPTYYIEYDTFLAGKEKLHRFLTQRPGTIPDPPLPIE